MAMLVRHCEPMDDRAGLFGVDVAPNGFSDITLRLHSAMGAGRAITSTAGAVGSRHRRSPPPSPIRHGEGGAAFFSGPEGDANTGHEGESRTRRNPQQTTSCWDGPAPSLLVATITTTTGATK